MRVKVRQLAEGFVAHFTGVRLLFRMGQRVFREIRRLGKSLVARRTNVSLLRCEMLLLCRVID